MRSALPQAERVPIAFHQEDTVATASPPQVHAFTQHRIPNSDTAATPTLYYRNGIFSEKLNKKLVSTLIKYIDIKTKFMDTNNVDTTKPQSSPLIICGSRGVEKDPLKSP
uniref:Uncharacterized protein n=1 Tax=Tolypothrix bouteillei VB521301 TaxID=1479485 RepID=A0A0C1QWY2_9CYAN